MNVVDSSAWLEFFADGPNAGFFSEPIQRTSQLLVPAITIFEVFKRVLQQRDESAALQAAALMQQGRLIALDAPLALAAAKLSVTTRLPLADSVVLASARAYEAVLWTQDSDFEGLPKVMFRPKQ
ncbi:MAG: type II toxin-antitoxin system VapC family toxin [Burkholderiales bacterium]